MVLSIPVIVIIIVLVCILSFFGYRAGVKAVNGPQGRVASWHIISFMCWTLVASIILGVALLKSQSVYQWLGGMQFISEPDHGDGKFDSQSFVGLMAVLFGIPLTISGAFYAIYLSQVALAISTAQIELTRRQLVQDHPLFESISWLWVLKARCSLLCEDIEREKKTLSTSDVKSVWGRVVENLAHLLNSLDEEDRKTALMHYAEHTGKRDTVTNYKSKIATARQEVNGLQTELVGSIRDNLTGKRLEIVGQMVAEIGEILPSRKESMNLLQGDIRE